MGAFKVTIVIDSDTPSITPLEVKEIIESDIDWSEYGLNLLDVEEMEVEKGSGYVKVRL